MWLEWPKLGALTPNMTSMIIWMNLVLLSITSQVLERPAGIL